MNRRTAKAKPKMRQSLQSIRPQEVHIYLTTDRRQYRSGTDHRLARTGRSVSVGSMRMAFRSIQTIDCLSQCDSHCCSTPSSTPMQHVRFERETFSTNFPQRFPSVGGRAPPDSGAKCGFPSAVRPPFVSSTHQRLLMLRSLSVQRLLSPRGCSY